MSSISANTTNDVRGEVSLLWTVIFTMTDLAACKGSAKINISFKVQGIGNALTVLASLVLVISECTV